MLEAADYPFSAEGTDVIWPDTGSNTRVLGVFPGVGWLCTIGGASSFVGSVFFWEIVLDPLKRVLFPGAGWLSTTGGASSFVGSVFVFEKLSIQYNDK